MPSLTIFKLPSSLALFTSLVSLWIPRILLNIFWCLSSVKMHLSLVCNINIFGSDLAIFYNTLKIFGGYNFKSPRKTHYTNHWSSSVITKKYSSNHVFSASCVITHKGKDLELDFFSSFGCFIYFLSYMAENYAEIVFHVLFSLSVTTPISIHFVPKDTLLPFSWQSSIILSTHPTASLSGHLLTSIYADSMFQLLLIMLLWIFGCIYPFKLGLLSCRHHRGKE